MGHTLVTRFDDGDCARLHALMKDKNANKIPYGRSCDRSLANELMDYHVTIFHWAKEQDEYYLKKLSDFHFEPCQIIVTGISAMNAEEGSTLLYFNVIPGEGFVKMKAELESVIQTNCSSFLHMTLAVDKDRTKILALKNQIEKELVFPMTLNVTGLDLYHIWKPVQKIVCF